MIHPPTFCEGPLHDHEIDNLAGLLGPSATSSTEQALRPRRPSCPVDPAALEREGGKPMRTPSPPALPDDIETLLRRLRLPHIRRAAPEVLATAKAQRWAPAEVLRNLLGEELAGRERSARALSCRPRPTCRHGRLLERVHRDRRDERGGGGSPRRVWPCGGASSPITSGWGRSSAWSAPSDEHQLACRSPARRPVASAVDSRPKERSRYVPGPSIAAGARSNCNSMRQSARRTGFGALPRRFCSVKPACTSGNACFRANATLSSTRRAARYSNGRRRTTLTAPSVAGLTTGRNAIQSAPPVTHRHA